MGRELQKKKNRSSIPRVRQKPKSKRANPLGNPIIAANWDSAKTLSQNYRCLGLTSRLNSTTGGTEVAPSKRSIVRKLVISSAIPKVLTPTTARVERDPDTGNILRVMDNLSKKPNPLNDLLNSEDEEEEGQDEEMDEIDEDQRRGKEIISQLEERARMVPEKRVKKQSRGEKEWVERLVRAHGDDFAGMMRDRKLNPMQQTAADISRRVGKWRAEGGTVEVQGCIMLYD